MDVDGETTDPITTQWIESLTPVVLDFVSTDLKSYLSNNAAVSAESSKAISADVLLLSIGYFLIVGYSAVVLWRNSAVFNKTQFTGECPPETYSALHHQDESKLLAC